MKKSPKQRNKEEKEPQKKKKRKEDKKMTKKWQKKELHEAGRQEPARNPRHPNFPRRREASKKTPRRREIRRANRPAPAPHTPGGPDKENPRPAP